MGYWPNSWNCNCHGPCGCINRGFICAPRGDDTRIVVSVFDTDDDEFDLTGSSEIVFIVATGEIIGGNMYPGGTVLIEKSLSDGEIVIAGNRYQFVIDVSDTDTADLPKTKLYYEMQVTTSGGLKKTVSAGIFNAENTMIKDIP